MKNRFDWFFVAAWLLLLAGCTSVVAPPPATPAAAPAPAPSGEQLPHVEGAPQQPAEESNIVDLGPRPAVSGNKAVIALLDRAQTDSSAGRREAAGASLERALRIESRNPWLWLELAQLRLAEGQYAQAITLARKSNSFAGHQHRVQAENWQVIARAREAQGDSAGADQALKVAADFAHQAKAEADRG